METGWLCSLLRLYGHGSCVREYILLALPHLSAPGRQFLDETAASLAGSHFIIPGIEVCLWPPHSAFTYRLVIKQKTLCVVIGCAVFFGSVHYKLYILCAYLRWFLHISVPSSLNLCRRREWEDVTVRQLIWESKWDGLIWYSQVLRLIMIPLYKALLAQLVTNIEKRIKRGIAGKQALHCFVQGVILSHVNLYLSLCKDDTFHQCLSDMVRCVLQLYESFSLYNLNYPLDL